MQDVSPDMTKWKRLYNASVACQLEHQVGNHVVMFHHARDEPRSQYTGSRDAFSARLNVLLGRPPSSGDAGG
jgi:hypothetical protein